jgi:anti-sigma factor RsiW
VIPNPPTPSGAHLAEALSAYLDDELGPAARRDAESHLAGCAACQAELEEVAVARGAVRSLPIRPIPANRLNELVAAGGQVLPLRPARRPLWLAAAAAAAVVAVLLPREEPRIAPALPALANSHAVRASVTGDPLTELAPIAVPVRFGP